MNSGATSIFSNPKHHSYIVKSDSSAHIIESLNSSLIFFRYDVFGVDDARFFIEKSMLASDEDKKIVIAAESITLPAQNALLKLIEEPHSNTVFFFLLPTHAHILDTLISRSMVVVDLSEESVIMAEDYLSKSPIDRMAMTDTLFLDESSEGESSLLNSLEAYIHKTLQKNTAHEKYIALYKEIVFIKEKRVLPGYGKHIFHPMAFV